MPHVSEWNQMIFDTPRLEQEFANIKETLNYSMENVLQHVYYIEELNQRIFGEIL